MSPTNKEKNTVTFLIHFDLLPAGQLDKNFILFSLSIVRNEVERHLLYTPKFFLFCFILFVCVCVCVWGFHCNQRNNCRVICRVFICLAVCDVLWRRRLPGQRNITGALQDIRTVTWRQMYYLSLIVCNVFTWKCFFFFFTFICNNKRRWFDFG
jgi:hypothetical protein